MVIIGPAIRVDRHTGPSGAPPSGKTARQSQRPKEWPGRRRLVRTPPISGDLFPAFLAPLSQLARQRTEMGRPTPPQPERAASATRARHNMHQNMSQAHNTSKSGPRRRNRNRNQRGSGHSTHSTHAHGAKSHAPEKPSLAQRLLGMIGLGKKKAPAKSAVSKTGKVTRESIPSRHQLTGEGGPRAPRAPREPRKPEVFEVTNPRLYIGNLSYDATETDLEEIFNGVGRVVSVEIVTNSRTQRSKGYGFVEMGSVEEAKRAVETLHDKEVMGRKMLVSGAKPIDESREQA